MTLAETERLENLLRTRQTELSRSLRRRDEIVIDKASDALDEVQIKEERELAIRNLDRGSNALRQIHRALSRIANATYGVCLHCEEDKAHGRRAMGSFLRQLPGKDRSPRDRNR